MMRLGTTRLAKLAMIATFSLATILPAAAWDRDRVYADSYGNLVIESAAGYKRILVGEGHEAERLAKYTSAGQPDVVYADRGSRAVVKDECYRPPVLVKGRSYMYGFDQGEIPLQGGSCR